ncbi:hypothetical protein SAMN05428945_4424 [Streptomyces sp. 2224.1]|nr:hypothetical protein SAMN05428945_4424 [Streptomyces sp. 2224.1]
MLGGADEGYIPGTSGCIHPVPARPVPRPPAVCSDSFRRRIPPGAGYLPLPGPSAPGCLPPAQEDAAATRPLWTASPSAW